MYVIQHTSAERPAGSPTVWVCLGALSTVQRSNRERVRLSLPSSSPQIMSDDVVGHCAGSICAILGEVCIGILYDFMSVRTSSMFIFRELCLRHFATQGTAVRRTCSHVDEHRQKLTRENERLSSNIASPCHSLQCRSHLQRDRWVDT